MRDKVWNIYIYIYMLRKLNEEGKPLKYNKGDRHSAKKKKNKGDRDIKRERKVKVPRIVRKLELCKKALHTY